MTETISNLHSTPSSERIHIGFFGCRNAGKSSLVNAITNQDLAVVSDIKGTTTDPIHKAMELLPLGPVVMIDTPGFDDEGQLGKLRIEKTQKILKRVDIAILVVDGSVGLNEYDKQLWSLIQQRKIPCLQVFNKADIVKNKENQFWVSSKTREGIENLKEKIGSLKKEMQPSFPILEDIIHKGDKVILVIPIDESAPKGRLILPQQLVLRNLLDIGATGLVCQPNYLQETIDSLQEKPRLVITDSQVFDEVNSIVPSAIALTSFSIVLARHKGYLQTALQGVKAISQLEDGDKILLAEGCTHHRQCNDIGTVKIPNWLRAYSQKKIQIDTCSGKDFPLDVSPYKAVIHCGGCMITQRDVQSRKEQSISQGVPFINYGIVIAAMTKTLERSISIFEKDGTNK